MHSQGKHDAKKQGLESHVRGWFPPRPTKSHFSDCQKVLLPHLAVRSPKTKEILSTLESAAWENEAQAGRKRSGAEEEVPGGGTERLSCVHCSATTAAFLFITSPRESGDMDPFMVSASTPDWVDFQLKLGGGGGQRIFFLRVAWNIFPVMPHL